MKLFPAIDLRGGKAVRLYQGDYDRMTVYNDDPAAQARAFRDAGAKYLHVVDLDGAKDDDTANLPAVAAIAAVGGLTIEVGGGIRDEARIRRYLDMGVGRCILGTVAVRDFAFTARLAKTYGGRIAVGVDMKDGFVAVAGWRELTRSRALTSAAAWRTPACRPSSPPTSAATAPCRAPIWTCTGSFCRSPASRSRHPAASRRWTS